MRSPDNTSLTNSSPSPFADDSPPPYSSTVPLNNSTDKEEILALDGYSEMKFGERLLDDLMNTFCDKIQKLAKEKIEGLLAIQTVDSDIAKSQITGKHRAFQILFIPEIEHYIVAAYDPKKHLVFLYDSLHGTKETVTSTLRESVRQQLQTLFAHIFVGGKVKIVIDLDYERQRDNWSCGYRSIACVLKLALNKDPNHFEYNERSIFIFLNDALEKDVTWTDLENAKLGNNREPEKVGKCHFILKPDLSYSDDNEEIQIVNLDRSVYMYENVPKWVVSTYMMDSDTKRSDVTFNNELTRSQYTEAKTSMYSRHSEFMSDRKR